MAIELGKSLDKKENWKELKRYTEESLKESDVKEYRIIIREATKGEQNTLLNDNKSELHIEFEKEKKEFEIIIGDVDIVNPRKYAENNVVDMINMFLYPEE
jgi:hypothetical protein